MLKLVSCWLTLSVSQTIASEVISQDELPPLAQPGKGPILLAEQIFPIEHKPTKECHSSTIVETPSGLVAAWFAGTREKDPDVGIWLSRKVDGTWTAPLEVVNGGGRQFPQSGRED